jgi:O-antigen ligase
VQNLIIFGASAFLLHVLSLTHNRGAIVGLFGVGLIIWLRARKKLYGLLIGLFTIIGGALLLAPQMYLQRFSTILYDQSVEGRINVWKAGLRMISENPIFGVGLGNFQSQSLLYGENSIMGALVGHNNFIHLGGEGGVVALALYVLLIAGALIHCNKLCRSATSWHQTTGRLMEASLVGYIIAGMFLSRHNYVFAYFVMGMVVGVRSSMKPIANDVEVREKVGNTKNVGRQPESKSLA